MIPQMPGNSNVVHAVNINLMKTLRTEPDKLRAVAQSRSRQQSARELVLVRGRQSAQFPIFANALL
jgi:hypothetical protein